jgi:hypothetical protein
MTHRHVHITRPILLRVERRPSSDACHIVALGQAHPELSVEQLVVGASHNNSNKSFLKMPSNLVQQELDRLEKQRQPYSLVISDQPALASAASNGTEQNGFAHPTPSASNAGPSGASSLESKSEVHASNHPYVMHTPPPPGPSHKGNENTAANRVHGYSSPTYARSNNNNNTNGINTYSDLWPATAAEDSTEGDADLSAARAAVDRLRQQRLDAERMRKEFKHSESVARSLSAENADLRSKVSALQEMIDAQNNLLADLTVSQEKVKALKEQEDQLSTQLRQAHDDREKERLDHTNQLADLRKQVATLQVKNNEDSLSAGEFVAELESARTEVESLRVGNRHLEQRVSQMSKLHESEMVQLSRERDVLQRRVQDMDDALQGTRIELVGVQDDLALALGREAMLREAVQESERSLSSLRAQLQDSKRVNAEGTYVRRDGRLIDRASQERLC